MGRPTPAHRLPATTSTHPEARRCRPTCQPDSAPRRTLTPPTLPHASNRLRTTLRFVAAIPCTPSAHHRTSLLWSPSSDFVPSQPHQLRQQRDKNQRASSSQQASSSLSYFVTFPTRR